MILDVMRVNAATFEKMRALSESYTVSGIEFRVPSLAHLIALKLHAARNEHRAQKDLTDVRELLRANPGKVAPDELRQLCRQFGTPQLAAQLEDHL
ncbi:MAG TPA: nucleotidyl transferase AbiEii/AbiGii toxin family protein [Prosthecobacter sp.]|nr:nucleotidyl transferase AbiEii/AbiGii toxin family protein [Prosthecobacter sp.]